MTTSNARTRGTSPSEPFGARLRRLRQAAGMSQTALAGDELHPSYISLLEAGRRTPTAEATATIAQRLGISVSELTGRLESDLAGPVAMAEAALGLGRPAEAVSLLEAWSAEFTVEKAAYSALTFRAGEAYATGLERVGRLDDAIRVLEGLRDAVESMSGRREWLSVAVSLVRCYRDCGDLGRAIDVGEQARTQLGAATIALGSHASLISTLASAYTERGDLARASFLLDDLLEETSRNGSLQEQSYAYWNSAITAVERGRPDHALDLADQAAALLNLGNDMRARARTSVTKAWILLAQTPPRAEEARNLLRDTLPLLRQYDSTLALASAETELARCEVILNRPDIARRHAQSALKRLSAEHPIERARALAALGAAYVTLGDLPAGGLALDESAMNLEEAKAPRQAAAVWLQLAEVFTASDEPRRALAAAQRALSALGFPGAPMTPPQAAVSKPATRRSAVRQR